MWLYKLTDKSEHKQLYVSLGQHRFGPVLDHCLISYNALIIAHIPSDLDLSEILRCSALYIRRSKHFCLVVVVLALVQKNARHLFMPKLSHNYD